MAFKEMGSHPVPPAEAGAQKEGREFIKPEFAFQMNQEALTSLAEEFPQQREMFERLGRLPPIKLQPGEVNFIFGANGSGKSTLANSLFLAAEIAHLQADPKRQPASPPEMLAIQAEARERILEPHISSRQELIDLIGMAAAPRIVRSGALVMTEFKARQGYGGVGDMRVSDAPIVFRIAVQDMLGIAKNREVDYVSDQIYGGLEGRSLQRGELEHRRASTQSVFAEEGASSRQMIEIKLMRLLEWINPGSVVVLDEATFGLSPKRQEEYVKMLKRIAAEKQLMIIAAENSGYAYDSESFRIDLADPERGLHRPISQAAQLRAGVKVRESRENEPEATIKLKIHREKFAALAAEQPKFAEILKTLSQLPESLTFAAGKTELFADNGGGKTTLLGAIYLLMQMEQVVQGVLEYSQGRTDRAAAMTEALRAVVRGGNVYEKVFLESLGCARELITSGAITLSEGSKFPEQYGKKPLVWLNLLELAGEVKHDHFKILPRLESRDVAGVDRELKEYRKDEVRASTRQTAEAMLVKTLTTMPEGGYLFVDEIDGGISPDRQLQMSDRIHALAREKGITLIATSNSYEGYRYRLTPSLDLTKPTEGIQLANYELIRDVDT